MPRAVNGTYTLPALNPVVTGTTIESTWANNTMNDIATAMTDSLSRSGEGGMLAPFKSVDGAIGAPGISFSNETSAGLYRASAGNFRFAIGGADILTLTAAGLSLGALTLSSSNPSLYQIETGAAANNRVWGQFPSSETMAFTVGNDALNSFAAYMTIDRTLNVIDGIAFKTGASVSRVTIDGSGAVVIAAPTAGVALTITGLSGVVPLSVTQGSSALSAFFSGAAANCGVTFNQSGEVVWSLYSVATTGALAFHNGTTVVFTIDPTTGASQVYDAGTLREVGFRSLPSRTFASSDSTAATDNGKLLYKSAGGGDTLTIDSDFGVAGYIATVVNAGSALAIAESLSGTLSWFNGSSVSTGARTLAAGGVCTIYMLDANNAFIWGNGIT